jgi:hypothetical protein
VEKTVPPNITLIAARLVVGAGVVIAIASIVLIVTRHTRVARSILTYWAQANGFQFISLKRRWFRLGPFWWRSGNAVVFRGVMLTATGERRTGYFRVGTFFLGIMIDQVAVEWDK